MKLLALIGLASAAALAIVSPAQARQGCGAGAHRGPYGHCRSNMNGGAFVVGRYYQHHGWWDGHRWEHHRYRYHHAWRYR